METIAKSDMFFFISSICFVVVSVLLVWFLAYAIAIAKDVKKLSARIEHEGEKISADLDDFRRAAKTRVRGTGKVIGGILKRLIK